MRHVGLLGLLLWHSVVLADDSVRISYRENNYIPDGSDVASELFVSRRSNEELQPQFIGDTD
jgi:hypothetical protein